MARLLRLFMVISFLVPGAGCSSLTVHYDWDRDTDFAQYRTFAWLEQEGGDAKTAIERSPLLENRIKNAINRDLIAKGLQEDTNNPDLLLVYHTGFKDKVNVSDYGYRYSADYWGYGGRNIDVYEYQEGTLIIDMIDANIKSRLSPAWRCSGRLRAPSVETGWRVPSPQTI